MQPGHRLIHPRDHQVDDELRNAMVGMDPHTLQRFKREQHEAALQEASRITSTGEMVHWMRNTGIPFAFTAGSLDLKELQQ